MLVHDRTFHTNNYMKNRGRLIWTRTNLSSTRMKHVFPLQMVQSHLDTNQPLFVNKRITEYKSSFMNSTVHLCIPLPSAMVCPKPLTKHLWHLSFTNTENFSHHFHAMVMFSSYETYWHIHWRLGKHDSFSWKKHDSFSWKNTLGSCKQIQYVHLLSSFSKIWTKR